MTNKEAIKIISPKKLGHRNNIDIEWNEKEIEALSLAIKALKKEADNDSKR